MSKAVDFKHLLRFGPFEADLHSGELRKGTTRLRLQEQPFKILSLLLLHPGEVVTREEIRKTLWGEDTFVDFERGLNKAVNRLREALGDSAESPRFIETLPKRGYRFIAPVEVVGSEVVGPLRSHLEPEPSRVPAESIHPKSPRHVVLWIFAGAMLAALVVVAWRFLRQPALLTERDTIVLADFENRTNDSALDGTLKEALSIALGQSPFLKILPDQQVADTLRLMLRNPDQRLDRDVARSVCRRTGSKAVLAGSIASLGSEYVIGLQANNCDSGDVLAREQARANRKEDILAGIDSVASRLRLKLGESLPSIQKYDRPVHEALSTASLDAFQAYANGERLVRREGNFAAIPLFKRAIELDPDFAYAHAALGLVYGLQGEANLAVDYTRKAYALRDHVSEWERYFISFQYEFRVTEDLDKAIQLGRIWTQNYPRERTSHNRLAAAYGRVGDYEHAAAELEQARVLGGGFPIDVGALARAYMALGRFNETKAILQESLERNPQHQALRQRRYLLAFLEDDQKLLKEQLEWAAHETGGLARFELYETEAYFGHARKSRELLQSAAETAMHIDLKERAAQLLAGEAVWEAEFGFRELAREHALQALASEPGPDTEVLALTALAELDDSAHVREQVSRLKEKLPSATLIENYWAPTILAEIEIASGSAEKAIELLRRTEAYELSSESPMLPVYVRGKAYLKAMQGQAAAAEFKKILDHQGVVGTSPIGALAYLELARALTISGSTSRARNEYQKFFDLWKDADEDIPILKSAKSEFEHIVASRNVQPRS